MSDYGLKRLSIDCEARGIYCILEWCAEYGDMGYNNDTEDEERGHMGPITSVCRLMPLKRICGKIAFCQEGKDQKGGRTCVVFCEPPADPFRKLEEFVRAI